MDADGFERLAGFDAISPQRDRQPKVIIKIWELLCRCASACSIRQSPNDPFLRWASPLENRGAPDVDTLNTSSAKTPRTPGPATAERVRARHAARSGPTEPDCSPVTESSAFFAMASRRPGSDRAASSRARPSPTRSGTRWCSASEVAEAVHKDYPSVKLLASHRVDAIAGSGWSRIRRRSTSVVASNLFGDILTDVGSAISGSLGRRAPRNIDPDGRIRSMFEPIHGSAPDIAGKGLSFRSAPFGLGRCARSSGHRDVHDPIVGAVERVVASGNDQPTGYSSRQAAEQNSLADAIVGEV